MLHFIVYFFLQIFDYVQKSYKAFDLNGIESKTFTLIELRVDTGASEFSEPISRLVVNTGIITANSHILGAI